MLKKDIIVNLLQTNIIQFGTFTLKSGATSNFYIDMRKIVSYPHLLNALTKYIIEDVNKLNISFDLTCGVPYAAIPIATLFSAHTNTPMIIKRKEQKNYGTKKMLEGVF